MRNEISVLIVDDEDVWIKTLTLMIEGLGMKVVKAVKTTNQALQAFKQVACDIILIDIQIEGAESGIELGNIAHNIYNKPYIYITAAREHDPGKIAAYCPAAYLQKPVNANTLNIAINHAIGSNRQYIELDSTTKCDTSVFFVKEGAVYKKLFWKDISCLTAGKNYVSLYNVVDNTDYYIRGSLQKIVESLIPKQLQHDFIQVNRSQVVQFSHIREISSEEVFTEFKNLPLSETYNKELKNKMNIV